MYIRDLYLSRCAIVDGSPKPTFWKPQPVDYYPLCLYSDTSRVATESATELVKRLITLGLKLEVEVGQFVLKGLVKELPKAQPELLPLLKSNAADEARHFNGFQYAAKTYGKIDHDPKLDALCLSWIQLSDSQHPIHVAGLMETSVFLISLGLMRIVGSPSLSRLAMSIAEDEYRHVQTNVAVSGGLGFWSDPDSETQDLIDCTLEWVWGDGLESVPSNLTLDNIKRFSRELVADLSSPEFDSLTWYSYHHLPFELPNEYMYSDRELAEVG